LAGAVAASVDQCADRCRACIGRGRPIHLFSRHVPEGGTPVPGNRPTIAIVRTGPYGFSRNPIYLAFTLLQIGLAAWINSVGVLIMLFPALALMALFVVPREERYLEARFPAEYVRYKRDVRRWL